MPSAVPYPNVQKPGGEVKEAELIDYCKQRMGKHEVPKAIVFLQQMPITATGKSQKHVLRSQYRDMYARPSP